MPSDDRPPIRSRAAVADGEVTEFGASVVEGLEDIEAMHAQNPDDPHVIDYLAFAYYQAGRLNEALELYEKLAGLEFRLAHTCFHLGNCYFRLNRKIRAGEEWRRCLAAGPPPKIQRKVRARLAEL